MNNKTNPVDVLAVMDVARECLRNSSQQTPEGQAIHSAVSQARAAIAALIEADKEFDRVFAMGIMADVGEFLLANDRRCAALAAVGVQS